ncbi:HD domain-containing protein [Desulfurococcus mucosus]|uniref:Metal dependent phosphohydrolase n=1 Tax=Desulfurococcus mucosus (strain ATCC 35584 / DSM 2162 / JCM 9187 / O7/1) TaxID=765177 RepID=E8R7W9_DESM0|nr:HD domain-containing protein [Desulfurococcus mucosus]ADV64595.1 metal dependent phosphohydrolase [Desulfurococcus mucosus DSM 2162]
MVSDPIYGYVYFNREVEEQVVNSILLQRLRYIMQLQTAHLVYPGAVHTRFQHSLGVMHLTGLVAEDLTGKLVSIHGVDVLEGYSPETLVEAARLAGLLHDVGHAAFGHSFEYSVLWKKNVLGELSNHEKIGLKLLELLLEDRLLEAEERYGLTGLTSMVKKLLGERREGSPLVDAYRWIIRDGLYPTDIMDFLRRDSYYAGTSEYGYISYERLYRNTYPFIEKGVFKAVLDRTGIGEFKQYMVAKASMYEHVYYHSVCRAFDKILDTLLEKLDEEYGLADRVLALARGEVEGFLELTDVYMYSVLLGKALRDSTEVGRLARMMLVERKPLWRRVGGEYVLNGYRGPRFIGEILRLIFDREWRSKVASVLVEELAGRLSSIGVAEDDLWVDVLDISPVPKSLLYPDWGSGVPEIVLYTGKVSGRQVVPGPEVNLLEGELPLAVIFRAYVKREKYRVDMEPVVSRVVGEVLEALLGIDMGEYRRSIEEAYKSVRGIDYSRFKLTM